jgi:hypothetical protein
MVFIVLKNCRNSWNVNASANSLGYLNSNGYGFKWFSIVKVTFSIVKK